MSLILMSFSLGLSGLISGLESPIGATQLQSAVQSTAYPNVYVSVSELQIPTITEVINGVGGYVPFFFGIFGVIALIWKLKPKEVKKEVPNKKPRKPRRRGRNRRKEDENEIEKDTKIIKPDPIPQKRNYIFYIVLFSLWLLLTAYAMTKGVRFIENFSLPIALSAGIFVGLLLDYVKGHVKNISYQKIIMAVIVIAVVFSPITSAYGISSTVVPVLMNQWYFTPMD